MDGWGWLWLGMYKSLLRIFSHIFGVFLGFICMQLLRCSDFILHTRGLLRLLYGNPVSLFDWLGYKFYAIFDEKYEDFDRCSAGCWLYGFHCVATYYVAFIRRFVNFLSVFFGDCYRFNMLVM